jgi:alkaline phosphatase D
MLGAEQWLWLQTELLKPAKVRIIASSTQFGAEYNGFESWSNFPLEQEKMYNLIKSTNASGVFFISGDIHYGELSKRTPANTYPIYDFTSSGITETYPPVANQFRIGNPFATNHIGTIDIDWKGDSTRIDFSLLDVTGTKQLSEHIFLKDISF